MNAPITAEALLAKLKALPPERLEQIADFVDFLAAQERRTPPTVRSASMP